MEAADVWLFYAINHGWSNAVLDTVMPFVTSTSTWRPIYALAILLLLWRGKRYGRICAVTLLVSVSLTDPLSNHFLKETIQRVGSGGGSFPSNHALNNAAAAMICTLFYRRLAWLWWSVTILIGVSRVYVGVHYPSDVLGGLAIGAIAGLILGLLAKKLASQAHPS
jgi:undecaprenyl-diphosphatase